MALSPNELQDLDLLETAIWQLLARGAADAKHAFKLCSLATVTAQGQPDTRMVVLRQCHKALKTLSFHTDARSGKMGQLAVQPQACMLFWDPKQSLQLRVYGTAQLHHLNQTALAKVQNLPAGQKTLFGFEAAPGSVRVATGVSPTYNEDLVAPNFCWISLQATRIDALHLGRTGVHTRAGFTYADDNTITRHWLVP
jgi:hypothetical protein